MWGQFLISILGMTNLAVIWCQSSTLNTRSDYFLLRKNLLVAMIKRRRRQTLRRCAKHFLLGLQNCKRLKPFQITSLLEKYHPISRFLRAKQNKIKMLSLLWKQDILTLKLHFAELVVNYHLILAKNQVLRCFDKLKRPWMIFEKHLLRISLT